MQLRPRPPRRASENVVPLINVVFLLLVFFMLTGTLAATPPGDIALPRVAGDGTPPPAEGARVVGLAASGALLLDGEPTTAAGLAGRLRAAGVQAVALRADARTPSRTLLPVLEALEDAGIARVDLVTELAR